MKVKAFRSSAISFGCFQKPARKGPATNITVNSATLNGTVNPKGLSTSYYFEWGLSTAYGNTTSTQSAGSGTNDVTVTANLSGLASNTTYHYRVVATNIAGSTNGLDRTFITQLTGKDDFNNNT
jgi:hypothetical protein